MAKEPLPRVRALHGEDTGQKMRHEGVDKEHASDDDESKTRHPARQFENHRGPGRRCESDADGHEGRSHRIACRSAIDGNQVDRDDDATDRQNDVRGCKQLSSPPFEPAGDDGAERSDQEGCSEPPDLTGVNLCSGEGGPCGQPTHFRQCTGCNQLVISDRCKACDQGGQDQDKGDQRDQTGFLVRCIIVGKGVRREQKEPQGQGARDVNDTEIPRLKRKLRQQRNLDPGPVRNGHPIEGDHVKGGVDRRQRGHHQIGAPGKQASVALDRFFIHALGKDRFVNRFLVRRGSGLGHRVLPRMMASAF